MINYKSYLKYVEHNYKNKKSENKRDKEVINITGKWHTNWGDMTLIQEGNEVSGYYDWNNGKIKGVLDGYVLKASWEEIFPTENDISKGFCLFKFSNTLMSFQGTWDKTGKFDNSKGSVWIGNRDIYPNQNGVDGSYRLNEGRLMLEEGNNNVSGMFIKEKYIDYIYLSGSIKSKENDIYIVEGNWYKDLNILNIEFDGKFELKIDKKNSKVLFKYATYDESINNKGYDSGFKVSGPNPLDVSGVWETNVGNMFIEDDHGILTITYKRGKGMMEGRIIGNMFLGYWYLAPTYNCPTHSGHVFFEFNTTGTSFFGYFTYCNREYNEKQKLSGVINR